MLNKNDYVEQVKAKLSEYHSEIDLLKAKAEELGEKGKLEYQKLLVDLEYKKEAANVRLNEFINASEESWEDLKTGVEQAQDEIAEAIASVKTNF